MLARTPNRQLAHARPHRAFSLVELMVVMAIIAVLVGMLLPALGGARRRAHKAVEMNRIKNLGHAWMLYANDNVDAALPGYLDVAVQQPRVMGVSRGWGVSYKYPNNSTILLTAENLTGPWTWRLLTYLDFDPTLVHGHLDTAQLDKFSIVSDARRVAYEPAFAYNGFYIGGWWTMVNIEGVLTPRYRFHDHCSTDPLHRAISIPQGVSQIRRSSEMVTFCSGASFEAAGVQRKPPDNTPGMHMVMPPSMQQTPRWQPCVDDPAGSVEILQPVTWAPIARYTNAIAILYADGHVDEQGYNALFDQRKWIDSAETTTYTHGPCGTTQ